MRQGAQGQCTRTTLRDGMGREVGGGFRMGDTCTPMADSGQKPELLQGSLAGHGEYLGEERRAEHPKQRDELSVSVRQKQMHRLRKQTVLGAVIRPSVVSDSWQPHGL